MIQTKIIMKNVYYNLCIDFITTMLISYIEKKTGKPQQFSLNKVLDSLSP